MKGLYNQIVLGTIAVSLATLAIINLDIIGSANAVVNVPHQVAKSNDAMLGEIRLFAGDFAPEGWALCDGMELEIDDYKDLYNIIGDAYGGKYDETFALPDLRGRVAVGYGSNDRIGEIEMASSRVFKSDLLRAPSKLPAKTATSRAKMNKKDMSKASTFQSAVSAVRTGDLGLNYIICIEGSIPE